MFSSRTASEPRDFIFATMPQFPWYHYPTDAENLHFGNIFHDLYEQAFRFEHAFAFKFTRSMTHPTSPGNPCAASKDQPWPACLGDFLKLLGQAWRTGKTEFTSLVEVSEVEYDSSDTILELITSAMEVSEDSWTSVIYTKDLHNQWRDSDGAWEVDADHKQSIPTTSDSGLFQPKKTIPEALMLEQACMILTSMPLADDGSDTPRESWKAFRLSVKGEWPEVLLHTMILLSAMIGCEIGMSAVAWVQERFVPVLIAYRKLKVLGLLAKHAIPSSKRNYLLSVSRHHSNDLSELQMRDLVLVDPETKAAVGIISHFNFSPIDMSKSADDEVRKRARKRLRLLYGDTKISFKKHKDEVKFSPRPPDLNEACERLVQQRQGDGESVAEYLKAFAMMKTKEVRS